MATKMARNTYLDRLRDERARRQPAIDALSRISALTAAAEAAATANREYRDTPGYRARMTVPGMPDQRAIDLDQSATQARHELARAESEGREAQRRVAEIDRILTAPEDCARLATELAAGAEEGARIEKQLAAASALATTLESEIASIEEAQRVAAETEADEAVAAKLEGRNPKTGKRSAHDADLGALRGQLEAARRIATKAGTRIAELVERMGDTSRELRDAKARVARAAFEQMLLDNADVIADLVAIERMEPTLVVDRLAVERRRAEVAEECRPWRPGVPQATTEVRDDGADDESNSDGRSTREALAG